jgi:hypothetical protein
VTPGLSRQTAPDAAVSPWQATGLRKVARTAAGVDVERCGNRVICNCPWRVGAVLLHACIAELSHTIRRMGLMNAAASLAQSRAVLRGGFVRHASFFAHVQPAPKDPILGITEAFKVRDRPCRAAGAVAPLLAAAAEQLTRRSMPYDPYGMCRIGSPPLCRPRRRRLHHHLSHMPAWAWDVTHQSPWADFGCRKPY